MLNCENLYFVYCTAANVWRNQKCTEIGKEEKRQRVEWNGGWMDGCQMRLALTVELHIQRCEVKPNALNWKEIGILSTLRHDYHYCCCCSSSFSIVAVQFWIGMHRLGAVNENSFPFECVPHSNAAFFVFNGIALEDPNARKFHKKINHLRIHIHCTHTFSIGGGDGVPNRRLYRFCIALTRYLSANGQTKSASDLNGVLCANRKWCHSSFYCVARASLSKPHRR